MEITNGECFNVADRCLASPNRLACAPPFWTTCRQGDGNDEQDVAMVLLFGGDLDQLAGVGPGLCDTQCSVENGRGS